MALDPGLPSGGAFFAANLVRKTIWTLGVARLRRLSHLLAARGSGGKITTRGAQMRVRARLVLSKRCGVDYTESMTRDYLSIHPFAASRAGVRNGEREDHGGGGGLAIAPAKPKLKRPPLYRVILLNDDYTPMEFVVLVLEQFFGMNREKATQVMLAVHTRGKGVCGIYPQDIAETKAAQVNQSARDSGHPLLCEVEPSMDDDEG